MHKLYFVSNPKLKQAWIDLLQQEGIKSESTIEETFGLFDDDQLIATASIYQNVIKCVAVDKQYQGGSIFNQIITHCLNHIFEKGIHKVYVYTKPAAATSFSYLGFKSIETVDDKLVFMEKAVNGFGQFIQKLELFKEPNKKTAAIVMNANPFSKGHQFLVTKASLENEVVHLFVLSEDLSVFDAQTRFELVKAGSAHLNNVRVHQTESYMVSAATFPSYFLKEEDDVTTIQARLDARIFVNHIVPALNISCRYVGSEPLSHATNLYNQALKMEFVGKCDLIIVDRLETDNHIISATLIRKLLKENKLDEVKQYVPETTFQFFLTEKGQQIIRKLQV